MTIYTRTSANTIGLGFFFPGEKKKLRIRGLHYRKKENGSHCRLKYKKKRTHLINNYDARLIIKLDRIMGEKKSPNSFSDKTTSIDRS